ncbi:TonB-dependent receptor [Sphingomonas oligophenolica]|uniref:TonB-dependent receptor n=1 Tax=Sphingomonas oligophenolica TaxID=301154 RepID=A0ABU9Y654_9SPHN
MFNKVAKGVFLTSAAIAALGVSSAASAQASAAAPAAAPVEDQASDIIVTAQRRDQGKQDVPITVSVLGEGLIQDAHLVSVGDVVQRTPGIGFNGFPASEPRIAIRGVGSSSRGASGDPSSAVFVDEIYNGRPSGIAFDPFDIARIEVLKGPQGTLFGRNVTGGAINIVTNRPNLRALDVSAEGTYGNYNQTDLAGYVNVPLQEGIAALRLGGALHRHDGYTDRIDAAGDKIGELDNQNTWSARGQLLVEPAANVRFHLTAETVTDRNKGPGNRIPQYMQPSGGFVDRFFVDPFQYKTYATIDGKQNRDVWDVRFKSELDLSFATLSYLGSFKHIRYVSNYDFDGSLDKNTAVGQTRDVDGGDDEKSDLFSHEFQMKSLPGSKITWVAGIYNYNAHTFRIDSNRSLRNPAIRTESITQDATTNSWAGYVDATVPITDTVNVFGGLRYTNDDKTAHSIGTFNVSQVFFVSTPYDVTASKSWGALSWRAGADIHLSRNLMLYGSVARGFKSGGFQDTPADAADAALAVNPETVTSYEVGQRGKFFRGRVTWNNSFFYSKYDNLQNRVQDPNGTALIFNAFATIYGYETELNIDVGAGLRLDATYAYTHARYDDFPVFIGAVSANYKGNRLDYTPDHKATVSPSYTYDFAGGSSLQVAADYSFTSRIYDNESNNIYNTRPPTNFIDARVVFKAPGNHWTVSLWGKNLTKEFTKTYDGNISGVVIAAYAPPRTYGATVRWKY